MGEGTCEGTLSRNTGPTCQAAKTSSASSQIRPLIRTSSAIEVIARVLVRLPLAVRWLNPPRSRFSWTYVERLFMCRIGK